MNIALFASPAVFAPLQGFYRWLTDGLTDGLMEGSTRAVRPMQRNSLRQSAFAAKPAENPGVKPGVLGRCAGGCAAEGNVATDGHDFAKEFVDGQLSGPLSGLSGGPVGSARPLRKITPRASARASVPVRMIRLREAGQARASVGRMVISGRMADVCAELDRLAACEAALH